MMFTDSPKLDWSAIRGVIVDMDGVIWRGTQIIEGGSDFFSALQKADIGYVFATNNSSRSVTYYVNKLTTLGIAVKPWQIISSATATAAYLSRQFQPETTAFVVGEQGLKEAMLEAGFMLTATPGITPKLVISGIDRHFTYATLQLASQHIRNGAQFIGTNGDNTFPIPDGLAPGAGSILAAIEAASGQSPQIIGKPEAPMFQIALQRLDLPPQQVVMIGDRLETDILGAHEQQIKSVLVLSGVAAQSDIIAIGIQPDAVYNNLAAILIDIR